MKSITFCFNPKSSMKFVQSGIIDKFTMQFELAWKLMRETLRYEGRQDAATGSPRSVIKVAYAAYDFIDEELWLSMLEDRNAAEHVYDSNLAIRLVNDILARYISEFENLIAILESIYGKDLIETF